MENSKDKIFSLSLTELSFILTFVFILITSLMIYEKTKQNEALQIKLDAIANIDNLLPEFNLAKKELTKALESLRRGENIDPEKTISQLIEESKKQSEINRLIKIIEDQDLQITNLSEIKSILKDASKENKSIQEKIDYLVFFLNELDKRKEMLSNLPGANKKEKLIYLIEKYEKSEIIETDNAEMIAKIKDLEAHNTKNEELIKKLESSLNLTNLPGASIQDKVETIIASQKENSDLKGQVQFLKNRLEANGGMDFPPCWADENGKIQFLFNVDLREENLSVARAWPESREKDALELPNIKEIIGKSSNDYAGFIKSVKPISDISRQQNCRHYVRIKNSISSAIVSDRRRLSIEEHFYKIETRR